MEIDEFVSHAARVNIVKSRTVWNNNLMSYATNSSSCVEVLGVCRL